MDSSQNAVVRYADELIRNNSHMDREGYLVFEAEKITPAEYMAFAALILRNDDCFDALYANAGDTTMVEALACALETDDALEFFRLAKQRILQSYMATMRGVIAERLEVIEFQDYN
jgi:hypothetical protein